jgi:chromosome segregation ATPase
VPEIKREIRALGKNRENSNKEGPHQELQDLLDEAKQLHQTISTLEGDWEALAQENLKLTMQLGEFKNRLQELSQAVVARDQKLKEVNQTHEKGVQELKREIEEKSLRIIAFEKENEHLRNQYQEKVREFEKQVVQREGEARNLRDEAVRLRQTVSSLEATRKAFYQIGSELKGQLEESRSRLERLSRGSTSRGKRGDKVQSHDEEELSTQDEIDRLWAAYKKKVKTVTPAGAENSHEAFKNELKVKEGD